LRDRLLLFNRFDVRSLALTVAPAAIDLADAGSPSVEDEQIAFEDLRVLRQSADERAARTFDPDLDDGIVIPLPEDVFIEVSTSPGEDWACDFGLPRRPMRVDRALIILGPSGASFSTP
jgi:hypothetical protein